MPDHKFTTSGLVRDAAASAEFYPFLEAYLLLHVREFNLTPGALALVLADIGRAARDRRTPLGKALVGEIPTPPDADPPNPRHVKPVPKRKGGHHE